MNYVLIGGAALVGVMIAWQVFMRADIRKVIKVLRYASGGAAALLTGFLLLRGQVVLATMTGYAAVSILRNGRLGPIDFNAGGPATDNSSSVRSRYVAMTLDHDTGSVWGKVLHGTFRGRDLMSLGENEMRALLDEVARDPDSLALLETWLDRNREGWREHFAARDAAAEDASATAVDADELAYEILGLKPGATADEIRAAHRSLMKGVHPDQGGSNYLAARINEAKDRLLRKVSS